MYNQQVALPRDNLNIVADYSFWTTPQSTYHSVNTNSLMPSRRTLLHVACASVVPLAGCTNPNTPSTSTGSNRSLTKTTEGSSTSTPAQVLPRIYFSEIRGNPEGDDEENLNEEYILIEMNADTQRDLSGFTLDYGEKHQYEFPEMVTEVESRSVLTIRSGSGENRVNRSNYPDYQLFVGSDVPLLNNDGMQLLLYDDQGELVDSVSYSSMVEGQIWIRNE